VYFTFLDRAVGYDCVRCGSRCCHGWGFAVRHEELIPFLGKAPNISPFLQIKKSATDAFNLEDGCWLLEADGRCGIEIREGRGAKPSVCRLFPLQPKRIAGELIADLKLLHCPLEDARNLGSGGAVIGHDSAAEVAEIGQPFARDESVPPGAPDDLLAREARIRDATAPLLDLGDSASLIARSHSVDEAELTRLRDRWRKWLGVAAGLDHSRTFALAIPALRMSALTTPGAAPWPRFSRALPRQLLAASFYMELAARAGRPATLRAIGEVWRSTGSPRQLLARWNEPLRPPADAPLPSLPEELRRAFDQVASSSGTVGEALEKSSLAVELRPLLLRLVADRSL
jgi:hypothetical protein